MIINLQNHENDDLDIIELQGEVENIELIDCELDKKTIQLHFKNFFLQGCIKDQKYTIIERIGDPNNYVFKKYPVKKYVYFFDKPPRYKSSNQNSFSDKNSVKVIH